MAIIMREFLDSFKIEKDILLGVCDASKMDYLLPLLEASKTPFVSRNYERRINPCAIMPSALSIIVIGVGIERVKALTKDCGRLAAIAVCEDYHRTIPPLLSELAERMLKLIPFEYQIYTDSGHLNERALAVKAGLGFIGKNGQVISSKYGTYFNIGYMLTNLNIEPDPRPTFPGCGDCSRCIDACIGHALSTDGLDAQKCVSYLTQRKTPPSPDEARLMKNWLYGCDICQEVCPFNAETQIYRCEQISLEQCAEISMEDFDKRYKKSALHWRGADVFRRNAAIAIKNRV